MATVPTYGRRRIEPTPLPNARVQAVETPASAGAPIGQAQQQLGDVFGRIATGPIMDIIREERARADDVANLTTLRQLNQLDQKVLRDPDTGYLNTRNLSALETRDPASKAWDAGAEQIGANLRTPRQQLFFEQQRVNRKAQFDEQADRHLVTERRRYDATETSEYLRTGTNRITVNAEAPAIVAGTIDEQIAAVEGFAARNELGEYETAALREKTLNESWSAAITQSLAARNPKLASDYFTWATANNQLTGSAMTQAQTAIAAGLAEQKGDAVSQDVWRRLGPTDPSQPVKLFDMDEEVRRLIPDDPDARKFAIDGLNRRKVAWDAQNDAVDAAATGTLGKMILELVPVGSSPTYIRNTYEQIRRTPAFINASPKIQTDVRNTLENEAIRSENRIYTEAQRRAAESSRIYTDELRRVATLQRKQAELDLNSWDEVWTLMRDPVAFSNMTYDDIVGRSERLGIAAVNRMLEAQAELKKPGNVSTAQMDLDQFKAIGSRAGMTYLNLPPGEQSPEQRASAGRMLHMVQTEIARREVGGKKLTYPEKSALMQEILDRKVLVDHGFFGGGAQEVSVAVVADPEDQQAARVNLADIPKDRLTQAVNQMRSARPWLQRLKDEEIVKRYPRAIERAYAAWILGLGDEEIQKRLLETGD